MLVLMVLARFRFPDTATSDRRAAAAPLERLAARATFDDFPRMGRLVDRLGARARMQERTPRKPGGPLRRAGATAA